MNRKAFCLFVILSFSSPFLSFAQPSAAADGIRFQVDLPTMRSVHLLGDFNGWSLSNDPMSKDGSGKWVTIRKLHPGIYQYAFLLDGARVISDPANDVTVFDAEHQRSNSVFTVAADGSVMFHGYGERMRLNDEYGKKGGTVYLNLIWRFHHPLYYDSEKDQIQAPFVRINGTKDYYDMAATVERYPGIHVTSALSPSLLWQLEEVYVKRMKPFLKKKLKNPTFDAYGFQARYHGKTDPWIDLCLKPAAQFNEEDKKVLYQNAWSAFSVSEVHISRFPELTKLYEKWKDAQGNPDYTQQEIRSLKFWAIFAHFGPEFYERKIPLPNHLFVDFRDLVSFRSDGRYYLKREIEEDDCQRVVADAYKVIASIVPKYQKLKYNPRTKAGQIEIAGTSYFDAILPLIIGTDIAKESSPSSALPKTFNHPEDAEAQMQTAMSIYQELFSFLPRGYVPPMGAVSRSEIPMLFRNGFKWFVSDESVLMKSEPENQPIFNAYSVGDGSEKMVASFGESALSNRIFYTYRNYYSENAADDFIKYILSYAPDNPSEEALLTVVVDGGSPWSWYQNDIDGEGFLNAIYRKLDKLYKTRAIITTTLSEYIDGNSDRGIKAHPQTSLRPISKLASGSQLNGNFTAWIGERSSNTAWDYLNQARTDLTNAGINPPGGDLSALREGSKESFAVKAFMSLFAAQGGDWFFKFSKESSKWINPKPYESMFFAHLRNAYTFAQKAGASVAVPALNPFVTDESLISENSNAKKRTRCIFRCQLKDREAITAVYIAGDRAELANLQPNTQRLWDNGEYGDAISGDNIWTFVVDLDQGPLRYKYTNSGGKGTWEGAEAFPEVWRKIEITGDKMIIDDVFGNISGKK